MGRGGEGGCTQGLTARPGVTGLGVDRECRRASELRVKREDTWHC